MISKLNNKFRIAPPNTGISRRAVGNTDSEATEPVVRGTDVKTKPRWLGRLDALLGALVFAFKNRLNKFSNIPKACPFCKYDDVITQESDKYGLPYIDKTIPYFTVMCKRCHLHGPHSISKEIATWMWNDLFANTK